MTDLNKLIKIMEGTGVVPDIKNYDCNKTFKENGVDSLDVMDILLAIEESLNIKFTEDEAEKIKSLVDVMTILQKR